MAFDRLHAAATVLGLSVIAAIALGPVAPAQAEPDVQGVQARVDKLYQEAEVAQERYHDARLELVELRQDLRSLTADQARQSARLEQVRAQVTDSVVRQLEGEGVATVGQVVVSDDPEAFLDTLSTMSSFNDLQQSLLADYGTELAALDLRAEATEDRAAEIAATTEQLAAEKATVERKLTEAESLLAGLEAEERERLAVASRSSATRAPGAVPSAAPTSGRAAAAVAYGLAQVGDAYVYGAAGEDAFDCSGLTMRAWAQAGVSLPHSSAAQYGTGTRIAASALQPGDLVFYYSPISHVSMYIGNGQIVDAANPGAGVRIAGLYSMPYVGAVRPG